MGGTSRSHEVPSWYIPCLLGQGSESCSVRHCLAHQSSALSLGKCFLCVSVLSSVVKATFCKIEWSRNTKADLSLAENLAWWYTMNSCQVLMWFQLQWHQQNWPVESSEREKSNGLKNIAIHSGLLILPCARNKAVIRDVNRIFYLQLMRPGSFILGLPCAWEGRISPSVAQILDTQGCFLQMGRFWLSV